MSGREFQRLKDAVAASGLAWRGAFAPGPDDLVPALPGGGVAGAVVLLGFAGSDHWRTFAHSPEAGDSRRDPLDRWSRRVIDDLAHRFGGVGLYPSDGPPWLPFQRWARLSEPVHPSPVGILIHPEWGLWHAYRGALALAETWDGPPVPASPSPCDTCAAKPCLSTCPAGAIAPGRYDAAACRAHVASAAGRDCLDLGCRARRACPVGAGHRYEPVEAAFHMRAFLG